jgi:hypothetical protein
LAYPVKRHSYLGGFFADIQESIKLGVLVGSPPARRRFHFFALARELPDATKEQAIDPQGPDRVILSFSFRCQRWLSCGLSPAAQIGEIECRGGVLQITKDLQNQIQLVRRSLSLSLSLSRQNDI